MFVVISGETFSPEFKSSSITVEKCQALHHDCRRAARLRNCFGDSQLCKLEQAVQLCWAAMAGDFHERLLKAVGHKHRNTLVIFGPTHIDGDDDDDVGWNSSTIHKMSAKFPTSGTKMHHCPWCPPPPPRMHSQIIEHARWWRGTAIRS